MFSRVSLTRAHASADHFFLSPDFHEIYLCILNFPLLPSIIQKDTCPFAHTYVVLSLDFDDIDNTPIAKRTHVLLAFAHTYVLLSPDFDDIENTCAFKTSPCFSPTAKTTPVLLVFFHTHVLASDFQELWHRVMTICLLTEVNRQWAMLVLGWVTVSVRDQLWDVSKLEFLCVMRLL